MSIERAKKDGRYWYLDEELDATMTIEEGSSFDAHLFEIGNYYTLRDDCETASRRAVFEAKVKVYLRALNGGKEYAPICGKVCFFIDGDGKESSSTWSYSFSQAFRAGKGEHIRDVIEKFGRFSFVLFFRGEL